MSTSKCYTHCSFTLCTADTVASALSSEPLLQVASMEPRREPSVHYFTNHYFPVCYSTDRYFTVHFAFKSKTPWKQGSCSFSYCSPSAQNTEAFKHYEIRHVEIREGTEFRELKARKPKSCHTYCVAISTDAVHCASSGTAKHQPKPWEKSFLDERNKKPNMRIDCGWHCCLIVAVTAGSDSQELTGQTEQQQTK